MASDDKKTKTSPAPKYETAVKKDAAAKKKDEGQFCSPLLEFPLQNALARIKPGAGYQPSKWQSSCWRCS